jgi:AMP-polyphosphate phosphotransferase
MFESAELGHKLSKEVAAKEEPELRQGLLDAQYELLEKKPVSVVILIGGVDGAGKGELANRLSEWMDPRHIHVHAVDLPTREERERPRFYRFWQALPPKGKVGVFVGSWYTYPIVDRVMGKTKNADLDRSMEQVNHFERMLSNEGVVVLKFWLHLSKKAQAKRLEALESNPRTRWRVSPTDWDRFERYDKFRKVSERALRQTSTAEAPWFVVEAVDEEYREITIGKTILKALRDRLAHVSNGHKTQVTPPPLLAPIDGLDRLGSLDLTQTLDKETYERKLDHAQGRLNLLFRRPALRKRSVVAVFEGVDAAGKGGAIRRITHALDARHYKVVPIAAPTDEEKARPYLWRFWRHLPARGKLAIFDRSWYGRVLVERVEGYCDTDDWMRAYAEINDFEEDLSEHGVIVVKFWLQISDEEQLKRFEERQATGFKRYKLGPEDWRNREKWPDYAVAANEMIERTSTEYAPWTLIEANDKRHARVKILETLGERLESEL